MTISSINSGNHYYKVHLCYTPKRLFTITESGKIYSENPNEYSITSYYMDKRIVDYAIIPEYEVFLNKYKPSFLINLENK